MRATILVGTLACPVIMEDGIEKSQNWKLAGLSLANYASFCFTRTNRDL